MSTEVKMTDGTADDLIEHLRRLHQKGTKGFTEEYLANLHKTLHQSKREPLPEHSHPDMREDAAESAESAARPGRA